jgi:hypothetical protein
MRSAISAIAPCPATSEFAAGGSAAHAYSGLPLLEESRTADGWCFGTFTEHDAEQPSWGDAFVVAPDGTPAGIIWHAGTPRCDLTLPPDGRRWGVYMIGFAQSVRSRAELVAQLLGWLPELKRLHGAATNQSTRSRSPRRA